jgi:hypothetical protein
MFYCWLNICWRSRGGGQDEEEAKRGRRVEGKEEKDEGMRKKPSDKRGGAKDEAETRKGGRRKKEEQGRGGGRDEHENRRRRRGKEVDKEEEAEGNNGYEML